MNLNTGSFQNFKLVSTAAFHSASHIVDAVSWLTFGLIWGGQWGGLKDESPTASPGGEPWWACGAKPPKADNIFFKIMHKYFVYWNWNFRQHLQHKKHFTTFPGGRGKCPPPLPCLRAPMLKIHTKAPVGEVYERRLKVDKCERGKTALSPRLNSWQLCYRSRPFSICRLMAQRDAKAPDVPVRYWRLLSAIFSSFNEQSGRYKFTALAALKCNGRTTAGYR